MMDFATRAEGELDLDPHYGIIVVFRAKRGDRIKVLLWDGSDRRSVSPTFTSPSRSTNAVTIISSCVRHSIVENGMPEDGDGRNIGIEKKLYKPKFIQRFNDLQIAFAFYI
jgi:hypothetical protein